MDRASLTIEQATSERLRRAKPWLSVAAGHTLTVDQQVNYLLDHWQGTHPDGVRLAADLASAATLADTPPQANGGHSHAT